MTPDRLTCPAGVARVAPCDQAFIAPVLGTMMVPLAGAALVDVNAAKQVDAVTANPTSPELTAGRRGHVVVTIGPPPCSVTVLGTAGSAREQQGALVGRVVTVTATSGAAAAEHRMMITEATGTGRDVPFQIKATQGNG